MDIEAAKEEAEVTADEMGEEDFLEDSAHPHAVIGGRKICLCQEFQQRAFLRKLELEAHVQFEWVTFCKELIYHALFPLSLPLIYFFEGGTAGILNRQYWGSRMAIMQWILGISFYAMNGLTPFYVSPDIVITNVLSIMRNMVVATKYGFYTKGDMAEMRESVLPHEVHDERTLFIAWSNPIPLRILKRQLLLSAIRNNIVKCTASLRVVPGASRHTVGDIMQQLSQEKRQNYFLRRRRTGTHKHHDSKDETMRRDCPICVKNGCTEKELEDRWIQVCMSRIHTDPKCRLPESGDLSPDGTEHGVHGEDEEKDETHFASVKSMKEEKNTLCNVDLPALLLAAYLLQHTGVLLSKKKLWHQVWKNPMTVWMASGCVAAIHSAIPFACRAISGQPSVWGGNAWYAYVISISSIFLNFHAMTMGVSFMLAGVAEFRRRYFSARLLNTLLKDGCIGKENLAHYVPEAHGRTLEQQSHEIRQKSEYHIGVAVDFSQASSIVGWWMMRVLVLDFGLVFSKRVKYYASYFSLYCGILMAFLVIELFAKGTRTSSYILAVVIFDLVIFTGLLALIVFPGGETNSMHNIHGATLVHKKMFRNKRPALGPLPKTIFQLTHEAFWSLLCRFMMVVVIMELFNKLRGPLQSASAEEREGPSFALEVMQTISEALAWDNTITKVTILGFNAGSEVVGLLLGFAGAAIGIAAQQFTAHVPTPS